MTGQDERYAAQGIAACESPPQSIGYVSIASGVLNALLQQRAAATNGKLGERAALNVVNDPCEAVAVVCNDSWQRRYRWLDDGLAVALWRT